MSRQREVPGLHMEVEPGSGAGYGLLKNIVVPRPVALISSLGENGLVNVAPFSFYGIVSPDPPLVGVAIGRRRGAKKDTVLNVERQREFVVHAVSEEMAAAINIAAIDFPPTVSEVEPAGFTLLPGERVRVPRVAEAPVAMECRLVRIDEYGEGEHAHSFVIGQVLVFHVRDDLWREGKVDCLGWRPLVRLGDDLYAGVRETFAMHRVRYQEWLEGRK